MRRLELARGRRIEAFDSVDAFVRGVSRRVLQVVFIEVAAGGRVGRHPAGVEQLYCVVAGSGWVSGGAGGREPIAAGEAVIWSAGEEHESGSDEGMTAIVVEAEGLDV